MADFDWDLKKYYWPRERVLRWWDQGWDWESLKSKPCPHTDYETYAEYYEKTAAEITFPDPRIEDHPPKISEKDFWGERWLTEFPAGSGKIWDPYHLPLFDPTTGDLSPKHSNTDAWGNAKQTAFLRGLMARMYGNSVPLSGIVVPAETNFNFKKNTELSVDFSDATFGNDVELTEVSFGNNADFSNASFGWGAYLAGVTFGDMANLSGAFFGYEPILSCITFGDYANLSGVTFGAMADLSGIIFLGGGDLSGTTFEGWAFFQSVKFLGDALFSQGSYETLGTRKSQVGVDPNFFPATLNSERKEPEESVFQDISFEGAEFWGDADFSGRHFAGKADFFGAKFHKIPIFHRATFAQDPIWSVDSSFFPAPGCKTKSPRTLIREPKRAWLKPVAARINRIWSAIPHYDWDGADKTKRSIEFELAYRRLKTLMLSMGARTAEHFFYTLEIKSRIKRQNVSKFEKVLAYFYWWVSDFGQSLTRPLAWLIGVNAATYYGLCRLSGVSAVQFLILCKDFCIGCWQFVRSLFGAAPSVNFYDDGSVQGEAFTYIAHNFFPGGWLHDVTYTADLDRSNYQDWINGLYQSNKAALYGLTAMHEILTLALLFLFGLALKRRFQIK